MTRFETTTVEHDLKMGLFSKKSTASTFAVSESNLQIPSGHVYLENGNLYLAGGDGKPLRFASFNAPELTDGSCPHRFEVVDTMRTIAGLGEHLPLRVTRTYTLRIKSKNWQKGHIMGWDSRSNRWILDEDCMKELDVVLAEAARHNVKLIIPIINASQGSATNWVGDNVDLCCMVLGKGPYHQVDQERDWYTNRQMIDCFKILLTQLMERMNTVNGQRYGSDPTILCWETGNEFRLDKRPAPGAWTVEIAQHIKSLAPHTLIMDGSYAKTYNSDPKSSYHPAVLASPAVDILSYHFYGDGEAKRVKKDAQFARKHGKAFIAGEYGFFPSLDHYQQFLQDVESSGGAGSLIWSLRPHSHLGGFKTHREDEDNCSYHVPGGGPPFPPDFDPRSIHIVRLLRTANYAINGVASHQLPPHPTPSSPYVWTANNSQGVVGLAWQGSAWAGSYEVWSGDQCVAQGVTDFVPESMLHVPVPRAGKYKVRAVGLEGQLSPFSNEVDA